MAKQTKQAKRSKRSVADTKKLKVVVLDSEDVATILAALRSFQERYENIPARAMREDWPRHFRGVKPLGTEDISELCERINCAPHPGPYQQLRHSADLD